MKLAALIFSLSVAASLGAPVAGKPKDQPKLTSTEQWVLEQLTKFGKADIANKFPEEKYPKEKRCLSAHFVESLLKNTPSKEHIDHIGIFGAIIQGTVTLTGQDVNVEVDFRNCFFTGEFISDHAIFNRRASFSDCTFDLRITFESAKFTQGVIFIGTTFNNLVSFESAQFSDGFYAWKATFNNSLGFSRAKATFVGLSGAHVYEGADFSDVVIDEDFLLSEATFFRGTRPRATGQESKVNFTALKARNLVLDSATFEPPTRFQLIKLSENLMGDRAKFLDMGGVDFSQANIGLGTYMTETVFKGPVSFEDARIGGNLTAINVELNSHQPTSFNFQHAECKGDAWFSVKECSGELSFTYATLGDLSVRTTSMIPKLTLSGTTVHRTLRLADKVQDLVANFLRVEGPATFSGLIVTQRADLTNSKFAMLSMYNVKWPSDPNYLRTYGMSYDLVEAGDEDHAHQLLLTLVNGSQYSAAIYTDLANYFTRQGYPEAAVETFIAGKRRERAQLAWWRPSRVGSLLLDWLVGYGRHPERAGYVCIGIVVLGCILFPASKMKLRDPKEEEKPEDIRPQYNRLWYSLGLFLPVVDLKTSDLWKPTNDHVLLQYYLRIHILLGWIFVPIFLAAISGLIK